MEKFIYQVKIERLRKKTNASEEILRIEDHLYQFYFIRSEDYDEIYHYISKTNEEFSSIEKEKKDNHLSDDCTDKEHWDSKKYPKNELKKKIFHLDKIEEDEILHITRKHFYQYDYNLWNEVNDWLNGIMFTHKKEFKLLFIPQSYRLALVSYKYD